MPLNHLVTPKCCKRVAQTKAAFLQYSGEALLDGSYKRKPPIWCGYGSIVETGEVVQVQIAYCPHCGKELPKLRIRHTKKKICEIAEDNSGCLTCDNELMKCRCLPPEFKWEPDGHVPHNRIGDYV